MDTAAARTTVTLPRSRTRHVIGAHLGASAICLLLLAIRAFLTNEVLWTGFFGNLLLAWIPLVLSLALCTVLDIRAGSNREIELSGAFSHPIFSWIPRTFSWAVRSIFQRKSGARWLIASIFVTWLLFLPNAAYIVTDFVHLKTRDPIPRWFDYILITSYAWTGLSLGYVALTLLHLRIRGTFGVRAGWLFVVIMLALSSFGIYLGRFLRWNSWDVLVRPSRPLADLVKLVEFATLRQVAGFCATFFLLSVLVYIVLHAIAHLHAPVGENASRRDDATA